MRDQKSKKKRNAYRVRTAGQTAWVSEDLPRPVESVVFSPNGKLLVSGSSDGRIWLWDVAGWRELHVLNGHTDSADSMTFSLDGQLLISGGDDGTVRLWGVGNRK